MRSDRPPLGISPAVQGDNLNGERYRLPADFEGARNLVLLAFEQWQQRLVDTWLAWADTRRERFPELRVYELPTLTRMYGLFRGFIDGGMRSGIPDRAARARTITLYLDRAAFLEALGLPRTDTIYALLVTPAGEVLWRAEGVCSEDAGRRLEAVLAARAP